MAVLTLAMLSVGGHLCAQTTDNLRIVPVRGNIYLLAGAGGNVTVSAGPQGLLLVDTGLEGAGARVLSAAIALNRSIALAGRPDPGGLPQLPPVSFVLNTSARPEHVGGNGDAGKGHPAMYAHEAVLRRMTDAKKYDEQALPTITFSRPLFKLSRWFNGEGVEMLYMPSAISDGDSIVHFRGSDVIGTGDIFDFTRYPPIDIAEGGSIGGELAALNKLLDLVLPDEQTQGGTYLVPGHGRICDTSDLAFYRNMVTIIKDRIAAMAKKGMTLEQIQKAKPTEDWDPEFGQDPVWTPSRFVEAVYKTLEVKVSHDRN